jgi:hypothetical protein
MRKLITLTLAVLMVGLFAAVVLAAVDAGDDPSTTAGTTVDTTEADTTTDETTTTETTTTETTTTPEPRRRDDRPAGGVDISGPCDEAEQANDPRCTGVQPRVDDDRGFADHSGRGRGGDDDDDRSGPGNGDDDHSGSGHGGDDDDHSGSGHGGDDGDSSGHGGGDDDDSSGHGGGDDD